MILSLLILLLVNASRSQQIFLRKVKDLGLLLLRLIHLEQDNEEAVDGEDDEDVPIELSMLVVTRADNGGLPTGYNSEGDWIVYDEAWDETAELLISDEVKESEVEISGIGGDERKNREVGESEVAGEVENCEKEDSDVEENDMEESDHFEDCNYPNFPGKSDHFWLLQSPAFTNCTHHDHRTQEGLFKGQNRSG